VVRFAGALRAHRIRLGVVVVVALLCAGSGLFLAVTQLAHTSARRAVAAAIRPSASGRAPSAANARADEVDGASTAPSAASIRDVLFVGASYTAGLGASPQTDGYAYLLGREPGWRTQVNGVSGTGFLNPGPHGHQTFAERIIHQPVHPHPDIVVFQGGRNDISYPAAELRAAAIETVQLTRKRFSGVQVVFLGPIPAHVPAPASQLAVAATLRSAAASCHAVFIDPIEQGWITPGNEHGYTGAVPAHPDNRGYAYIAGRVQTDLGALFGEHSDA
jgi:lysophospholipase L1-like esterase